MPEGNGLTMVGDSVQWIQTFHVAELRDILDFPGHFAVPARAVAIDSASALSKEVYQRRPYP